MAQAGEPLWIPNTDNGIERLSKNEYLSSFPKGIELEPMEMKSEASRQSAVIFINHTKLVEILMDVVWSPSPPLSLSLPCICVCPLMHLDCMFIRN